MKNRRAIVLGLEVFLILLIVPLLPIDNLNEISKLFVWVIVGVIFYWFIDRITLKLENKTRKDKNL